MRRSSNQLYWITASLGALILMVALTFSGSIITTYTGTIADDLGISRASFSILNTLRSLTAFVVSLRFYRLLHRFSLKPLILCGLLLNVAALLLLSLCHALPTICLVGIISGFTSAFNGVVAVSLLVRNWFQQSRGLVLAVVMSFNGVGSAIIDPLLSLLITTRGWRIGFQVLSLVTLALFVLSVRFLHPMPQDIGLLPYGATEESVIPEDETQSGKRTLRLLGSSLPEQDLRSLVLMSILFSLSNLVVYNNLASVVQDMGFSQLFATGISISCAALANCAGKLVMGKINDHFGEALMLKLWYGLCPLSVLCLMVLYCGASAPAVLLGSVLVGASAGIYSVPIPLVCNQLFSKKSDYVYATSICMAATNLAIAASNPLFHGFYDFSGTYSSALLMALLLGAICFLITLRMISRNQTIFTAAKHREHC